MQGFFVNILLYTQFVYVEIPVMLKHAPSSMLLEIYHGKLENIEASVYRRKCLCTGIQNS